MGITTDPAKEFTDLCLSLRSTVNTKGAEFLACRFEVEPWSTDFMLIMASLHQRITNLQIMLNQTELDADIKEDAHNCLEQVRQSFTEVGLVNHWTHATQNYLTDANLRPIRMTSAYFRPHHGYTVPEGNELLELINLVDDLLHWLREHELSERDFIRSALIEGLMIFRFRVERVGWFGWPDTFESLKAVVAAYLALERGQPENNQSPPYDATVKKVKEVLTAIFDKVNLVKDVQETGDWLLRGYGAIQVGGVVHSSIAGLLTHVTK